ncbi:MAG: BatD family protein [Verrucomicrobia bacterium]|nr:BatD family protein [Verrucomicrobiota bacterium]
MNRFLLLTILLLVRSGLHGQSPPDPGMVTVRLRDVSRYTGQPFGFYVQVPGVSSSPEAPEFQPSADFEIRLTGSAPATQDGYKRTVFTFEAIPRRGGDLRLPGGEINWEGRRLEIPGTPVSVRDAVPTGEMTLQVSFPKLECYVGEPLLVTVTWTSTLSFNGVRAVHFRLPLAGSPHFKVHPAFPGTDPKEPGAIGLPVSEERVIAKFSDSRLDGKEAVKISFQRLVVVQPGAPENLTVPAAVLLCSYAEPRNAKFKGARYPSYFNNEFFEEEPTGNFERFVVRSAPVALKVRPLPESGRPSGFSGLVGAFRVETAAEPATVGVGQPVTLTLSASGMAAPSLLDLPALLANSPLAAQFVLPEIPVLPRLEPGKAIWSLPIRPRHEQVVAIPALTFSYFDPETGAYGETRSEPIPLRVQPVATVNLAEARFADGTRLRNEVRPEAGGIFHNRLGRDLARPVPPGGWTWPWTAWGALFGLPPLLWLGFCRMTRDHRLQLRDPEAVRRELAWQRFRREVRALPAPIEHHQVGRILRRYFADRFGLQVDGGDRGELRRLGEKLGVAPETVTTLESWIGRVEWAAFAPSAMPDAGPVEETLLALVKPFEAGAHAKRTAWGALLFALGLASLGGAESPSTPLEEAGVLFARATELAPVDPGRAEEFYRLAAERYEIVLRSALPVHRGLVLYNLANCHFLAGDRGRAILNYRRAEPWMRGDPQWRQALAHARDERPDIFPLALPLPWVRRIFFWHHHWTDQTRLQGIGICFAAGWILAGLRLYRRPPWLGRAGAALGGIVVTLTASSLVHAVSSSPDDAVILAGEVTARKGDAAIYESAFSAPLHAGAEVVVLEQRGAWWRIRVEDGNEGWIPADTAELVNPKPGRPGA